MKKVLALVVAAMMAMSLVACGGSAAETSAPAATEAATEAAAATQEAAPAAEEAAPVSDFNPADHSLGICIYPSSNPTIAVMTAGWMDKCDELGYEGLVLGGDTTDAAVAIQNIDTAAAQYTNFDCLGIVVQDETQWMKLKEVADKGVKIVLLWNSCSDAQLDELGMTRDQILGWYAPNAYDYGQAAAKDMADHVGHKGVIAITESQFNETEDNAAKGFMDYIKDNEPDMSCLDPQVEGLETVGAIGKIASIIQANPDIVGAYGTTGTSAQSWAAAAEQTGWDGAIIGMDFNAQNLDLLESGKVYALVAQPIYDAFSKAVELCDRYEKGENVQSEWTEDSGYMDSPIIHQADSAEYKDLISGISIYKSISE